MEGSLFRAGTLIITGILLATKLCRQGFRFAGHSSKPLPGGYQIKGCRWSRLPSSDHQTFLIGGDAPSPKGFDGALFPSVEREPAVCFSRLSGMEPATTPSIFLSARNLCAAHPLK